MITVMASGEFRALLLSSRRQQYRQSPGHLRHPRRTPRTTHIGITVIMLSELGEALKIVPPGGVHQLTHVYVASAWPAGEIIHGGRSATMTTPRFACAERAHLSFPG